MVVFEILFSILDSTNGYSTSALLAGLMAGIPLFLALAVFTLAICLPPGMQINYTFRFIGKKRQKSRRATDNTSKNIKSLEEKRLKEEQLREWVEMSYRRLGKTLTYEDYLAEGKNIGFFMFLGGVVLGVLFFVMTKDMVIMVVCAAVGVLMMVCAGEYLALYGIKSKIKQLNFAQKVELPVLISRFQAVSVDLAAHPFNRVLELYLPHSTALKYDIEMCLADRRSYGDTQSLTLWQKRVTAQAGSTMIEFTQFCERIKKMYTTGDGLYIKTELASDIKIIDTKYVEPYIKKQSENRLLKLMAIMLGTFTILACFMMLPMVIQIWEALKGVSL